MGGRTDRQKFKNQKNLILENKTTNKKKVGNNFSNV